MMKTISTLLLFLGTISAQAQDHAFQLGARAGAGYTMNPGVDKILVPEDYYSNYSFKEKGQVVPTVELYFNYHKPTSVIGAEAGFHWYQKASTLQYEDNQQLNYKVKTRYNYLGATALFKVYPWKHGLSIAAGGRLSFNLNPEGLKYESNQDDEMFAKYGWSTTDETQRLMQQKIKGNNRPNAEIGGGFGYEFKNGIVANLRYYYGLSNTIRTEQNDFHWVEQNNHSHSIELTVGYQFGI